MCAHEERHVTAVRAAAFPCSVCTESRARAILGGEGLQFPSRKVCVHLDSAPSVIGAFIGSLVLVRVLFG